MNSWKLCVLQWIAIFVDDLDQINWEYHFHLYLYRCIHIVGYWERRLKFSALVWVFLSFWVTLLWRFVLDSSHWRLVSPGWTESFLGHCLWDWLWYHSTFYPFASSVFVFEFLKRVWVGQCYFIMKGVDQSYFIVW